MVQAYIVGRRLKVGPNQWLMPGERWVPSEPLSQRIERALIRQGTIERVWVDPPKKRGRPPKLKEAAAV